MSIADTKRLNEKARGIILEQLIRYQS